MTFIKRKKTICIIGCGMAGGIVAQFLSKKKFNLIIIDSDKLQKKYSGIGPYKKFRFFNFGKQISKSRGFGYGGSSNLWHGVITELEKSDLDKLNKIAGSKVSNDLIRYYKKIYNYFDINFNFIKNIKKKLLYNNFYKILLNSKIFLSKNIFVQKEPLRIRNKILDLKIEYPEINIIENIVATSLNSQGTRKDYVKFVNVVIDKQIKRIYADIFIISCGSIETPRLILQSIRAKELNLQNNNIGKNIKDHPWSVIGKLKSNSRFHLKYFDVFLSFFYRKFKFRLGFSLKNINENKDENHCIVFKPKYSSYYINFKKDLKKIISLRSNFFKKIVNIFKKNSFLNLVFMSIYFLYERLHIGPFCQSSDVFCYLDQSSNINSFIKLSKKIVNHRNLPIVKWGINKKDLNEFRKINFYLVDIFKSNTQFIYKPNRYFYKNVQTGSHHAGSMRISRNSKNGVVDRNLKIHGLKNVYICDNSIFPFYGNSNPSFTLAAFALRLSNYLNIKN